MEKIVISCGDFLKNAGIVGFQYLLEEVSDAEEDEDYGIIENKQGLWIDREFVQNTNWTELYVQAFVKRYGAQTVYQTALDKIQSILTKAKQEGWDKKACKEDLKFLNEKLLSNSYQSGFATIRQQIENPQVYETLKNNKLKENMETEVLCERLQELLEFLLQPLCRETFCMKSIIYNYINRFWEGRSFLLRANASKDIKELFEADFSQPLRRYVAATHKTAKELCIDCGGQIDAKEKISIAFMKDQADDLSRKRSAFWNCKVDAYLCPVCAFLYALVPLGFNLAGRTFVFINMNQNVRQLLQANAAHGSLAYHSNQEESEKYASWIARTVDLLLQEKSREIGNIQVITRGLGEQDRYTFDVVAKDVLRLFHDSKIAERLNWLSKAPFVKAGKDYWNIHEAVILNILRYQSQYRILSRLLKMAIEDSAYILRALYTYDIQLRSRLLKRKSFNVNTGGGEMDHTAEDTKSISSMTEIKLQEKKRYVVRDKGFELRKTLLEAKGAGDDACIRGTVYQLLNALSVGNTAHFMEIIMRVYCATKLQIPDVFIEFLKDREIFTEYGYAFLIGLQGGRYEKKEEDKEHE